MSFASQRRLTSYRDRTDQGGNHDLEDCRRAVHVLDQLGLLLYPIVVGTGKRLFEDWTGKVPLKLVASRALSNGALSIAYESSGR